jgi:choline-sulfatase
VGAGVLLAGPVLGSALLAGQAATTPGQGARPNFLFISTDQQGADTLSAYGCTDVKTPNMDRLVRRGVSFARSYTTNPLCSPARSSWLTGRMPSETGVVTNGLEIRKGMPTMGQVLGAAGYETCYCGKLHLPQTYMMSTPGFNLIPVGMATGHGHLGDTAVSHACQTLFRKRSFKQPFAMVAALLQPHDICFWIERHRNRPLTSLPFGLREDELPQLPPNFEFKLKEPAMLVESKPHRPDWTPLQWRYYLWSYYRELEMADAEIGRILDALDESPYADNTVIVFTSDHGEGRARHKTVTKNYLYEEAARVPMIVCPPGRQDRGARNDKHLVSGVDILPTMCDYAGIAAPSGIVGRSLRPLVEGRETAWRDCLGVEVRRTGRMLRSQQYKYITYKDDPVEQLFDLKADPWETRNLAESGDFAAVLQDHRAKLAQWEAQLDAAPLPASAPATGGASEA